MEEFSVNEVENQSKWTHFKGFLTNLIKFFLALWTVADMAFDVRTTYSYYEMSRPSKNDSITFNNTIAFNNTSEVYTYVLVKIRFQYLIRTS